MGAQTHTHTHTVQQRCGGASLCSDMIFSTYHLTYSINRDRTGISSMAVRAVSPLNFSFQSVKILTCSMKLKGHKWTESFENQTFRFKEYVFFCFCFS